MKTATDFDVVRLGDLQQTISESSDRLGLYRSAAFSQRLKDKFDSRLDSRECVLSLDVFDTMLIRDNSSELERFVEIGARLYDAYSSENGAAPFTALDAFVARQLGTYATYRASRKLMGAREGSLAEIHQTAARLLKVGDEWAGRFVETEIAYEAERITPNPFLMQYVADFRAAGGMVILLSDMYFHAEHIARLLEILGVDTGLFDRIYSSGDSKISKASGLIFGSIESDLDQHSFFHVGDNFRTDFIKPRESGWDALHLPISNLDLRERRLSHDRSFNQLAAGGITVVIERP